MNIDRDILNSVYNTENEPLTLTNYKKIHYFKDLDIFIPSLAFEMLDNYRAYLYYNSDIKDVDPKYYRRPDLYSYDMLGDTGYFFIILYINDMFSFMDFVRPKIRLPHRDALNTVVSQMARTKSIGNVIDNIFDKSL